MSIDPLFRLAQRALLDAPRNSTMRIALEDRSVAALAKQVHRCAGATTTLP
jgi:hypothetical protein